MFPLLIQNFLSHGSSRIITTLARLHCACMEIPHEVSPLMIPSGELWPTLFVPQRMKIQDKVEFERNFRFFILHTKFWILSPEIPKFNALCLEKYSDQTSINKIFEGKSFSKKSCSQNFSYQPSLLLYGVGIKWFDISISDIDYITIVIYYL